MTSIMTPREIVDELDKYIIGQKEAKKSVAIALRNRYRRMQVEEVMRNEITPKNILMIGPTGVGKTEISRRLAKLANAPFIKVEATKFTEIGYVGRDVDSIIRDLAEVSYKMTKEEELEKVKDRAKEGVDERILDALVPHEERPKNYGFLNEPQEEKSTNKNSAARELMRNKLQNGELEDKEIEIEVLAQNVGVEIMSPPGMEEMTNQLQSLFQNIANKKTNHKTLTVREARKILQDEEAVKMINEEKIKSIAVERAEQNGIVFIDEIDKITQRSSGNSGEVSREGVQRDLLPLIEGSNVSTKYGRVKTDHILFVASGAFHLAKPSDLIPELQGRLPIRVELDALKAEDFERIISEPDASLCKQYTALLETEGVEVVFEKDGIAKIAEIAYTVNERNENIGARRLHTVMEKLLEDLSFQATEMDKQKVCIDKQYVENKLSDLVKDQDLSQFIL